MEVVIVKHKSTKMYEIILQRKMPVHFVVPMNENLDIGVVPYVAKKMLSNVYWHEIDKIEFTAILTEKMIAAGIIKLSENTTIID